MEPGIKNIKTSMLVKTFLLRFAIFAAGWLILAGGQPLSDLGFVILFVALTALISLVSVPPGQWRLHPLALLRFFPFFIYAAIRGGWDVARRVFFRTIPIDPAFITITHDRHPQKTLILAWFISLLPGTASTIITEDAIVVHVLDKKMPVAQEIEELKQRIDGLID